MQSKTLFIVRGLPGSGKSTLAKMLAPTANFAADDFFTLPDGTYNFDPTRLSDAHYYCLNHTKTALWKGTAAVAVHNVFSQPWQAREYYDLAREYGYSVFVIECQNRFTNIHQVPSETIARLARGWSPRLWG